MVYTARMVQKNGFTLIELLIVVAIIGILSSVVLVNLSGSRGETSNAKVKYELRQIQTLATLYRLDQNPRSFSGFCKSDGDFKKIRKSLGIDFAGSCSVRRGVNFCRVVDKGTCNDSKSDWLVYARNAEKSNYWCVDNSGKAAKLLSANVLNYLSIVSTKCP